MHRALGAKAMGYIAYYVGSNLNMSKSTLSNKMTVFTGGDRGVQLGSWFSPMLYAADLIDDHAGWTSAERINFKY